jgi:hypothetical protein
MKSKFFLLFLLFLTALNGLFAFGKKQKEEAKKPVADEWTLCITAFDVSAISPAWQTAGDTITRSITANLQNLDFRFRGEEESVYYRDYAWAKSNVAAMDALVKKRNERDLLLFRGDPEWKYEKDLKAIDAVISKLEQDVAAAVAIAPLVEEKPVFVLSEKNRNGTFPPPPLPGTEYRFCTTEKADAFLTGTLSEYYGRIYLDLKMYTRHTGSYSYKNSMLFSTEDLNKVIAEITDDLARAVSDTFPSAILVRSNPAGAMVTIDGVLAAQGETEPRMHSPGTAEIAVTADNHISASFPLELKPGELAEVSVDLTPRGVTVLDADVSDKPGSKVFLGGLYMGETPLTLELPKSESAYISVETPEGEVGSMIIQNSNLVSGSAQFFSLNDNVKADFFTAFPVSEEEKMLENNRKKFYSSYGTFWFILPVALLAGGIAETHMAINQNTGTWSMLRMGANAAWVAALGVTFYQIFRYIRASEAVSTPIVKAPSKNKE